MRRFKIFILFCLMGLSISLSALENSVTILMSDLNTFVGSDVEISILVVGDRVDVAPTFGKFKGATASFVGVNKVANVDTFSHLFQYLIHFNKAGKFEIPPVTATVDGNEVRSKPISFMVEDVIESDEVKLSVSFSKAEVFVGEPLLVTVKVETNTPAALLKAMDLTIPVLRDSRFQSLDKRIGVVKNNEVGLPVNRTRVIADVTQQKRTAKNKTKVTHSIFTFYKILKPLVAGDLVLSPSRLVYSREKSLNKRRRNYQWNQYPSYFSNNLFLNTPSSDKYSRFKYLTNSFKLKVKPLPKLNRPATFNGIITPFKVSISTKTHAFKVGDPISLTLVVKDALFLETFELPKLNTILSLTKNFSVAKQRSAATLDVTHNVKTFHQTIRPLKSGIREIPALRFSYFSTIDQEYHYVETKPIAITVKANADFSGFDVKFSDGSAIKNSPQERETGLYFNYPDSAIQSNHLFSKMLNSKLLFWFILVMPLLLKGLFELFKVTKLYRGSHHYISSSSYRKFRRTPIQTKSQLHQAVTLYFSRRMHVETKSVTYWDVEKLVDHQVDLAGLKSFWDGLDHNQFSEKNIDNEVDRQMVKSIRKIIKKVEKVLPVAIVLFISLFSCFDLQAATASSLFDQAEKISLKNYENGKVHFLVSAEKYLVEAQDFDSDESKGRLYYNAANAFFLANDLGNSMLYYLRAEKLIPNDHQLYMNRRFVESERIDDIQAVESRALLRSLFYFHYELSPTTRFWSFTVCYLILLSLYLKRNPNFLVKNFRLVFLVCTILFATSIIVSQFGVVKSQGVIIATEITAFKGPGPLYEPAFITKLHAGTTFSYLGSKEDWVWIVLEDGKQCWIPKKSLELI